MIIITNLFFWIFFVSLILAYFCWRLAGSSRDKAAFADLPADQQKFELRTKVYFTLFAIFIVAALLGLGLLAYTLIQTRSNSPDEPIRISTLTATPSITPTLPTTTPAPSREPTATRAPTGTATQASLPTLFIGNTSFQGVNMRAEPSLSGKIVARLMNATVVTILDEPTVDADGYTWQKIRLEDGTEGWVANIFLVVELIFPSKTP